MSDTSEPQDRTGKAGLSALLTSMGESESSGAFAAESELQQAISRGLRIPETLSGSQSADHSRIARGTQIGQYEICDFIGSGGMGSVYLARHVHLGTSVAIKLLSQRRESDTHAVARFEREMRLQAKIDHPNVVAAIDGGVDDNRYYVVMKHILGHDVHRIVRQLGPLHPGVACEIVRQAALGLSHLHQSGLIHRDIKPANTLVGLDGVVRLIDFGLARVDSQQESLTKTDHIVGTLSYMAPELISGREGISRQSDLYSLGATLYFLLTGKPPDRRLFSSTDWRDPELHSDSMSPKLYAVMERFLSHEPHQRFESATQAAEALNSLTDKEAFAALLDELRRQPQWREGREFTSPSDSSVEHSTNKNRGSDLTLIGKHNQGGSHSVAEAIGDGGAQKGRFRHAGLLWVALTVLAIITASAAYHFADNEDVILPDPNVGLTQNVDQPPVDAITTQVPRAESQMEALHRKMAEFLVARGAELYLFPSKTVRSIDQLPAEPFILLNIKANEREITDDDCKKLAQLTGIKALQLGRNPLSDLALEHLAGLERLQWLYLGQTAITDAGVIHLLPHRDTLETIDIQSTAITDQGVATLIGFEKLRELFLADNAISDRSLDGLSRFPSLKRLDLSGTEISDDGLPQLSELPSLEYLLLDRTMISDAGLGIIGDQLALKTLSIKSTSTTEAAVQRLRKTLPECQITWTSSQ
ncbi:protein kinase domain-containing protein [Stieleria varia]|uniref:Serine/threonine-protein kinase PrkC n=1 Tax=Stieleria varia TaxID=2528005 RepID=A0A5C5ZZF5_9BACT|nr:protein kinase [Stieleria varia]TWT92338.1 Serine/threonine-protein kinase PrkC [Stieleria varia]